MMSSSSPSTVAVEKATSDLLMVPDWTMNINICDLINAHHWQAKDVIKALKKRLQHKNPKVQLLTLTLLETLVKNCADHVHPHIGDKSVLGEMVKIVKKKADVQVRSRVLILLNAWQEAFGCQNGKRTQYFWAYEDLRRCGVQFPQLPPDAAQMLTKTAANPDLRQAHIGLGSRNSSKTLDETMAAEVESLSLSMLDSMRNIMELLNDMLQVVNPIDRAAVKDELITDLVNGCRSNQRKLIQMLTTTRDDGLLAKGLELNDNLQIILARHDAIESGSPLPISRSSSFRLGEATTSKSSEVSSSRRAEENISSKPTDVNKSSPTQNFSFKDSVASPRKVQMNEEEDEEEEEVTDDFVQLARRHSRTSSISQTQSPSFASSEGANGTEASYALALTNPPEPVKTSLKEQDMIDLLSLALVPTSDPSETQPSSSPQDRHQGHTSSIDSSPHGFESYPGNQVQAQLDSYVVPWAQPQSPNQQQTQVQVRYQLTPQLQYQFQETPQYSQQPPFQIQLQTQFPTNCHPQFQSPSHMHLQPQLLAQSQLQYQTLSQPRYCTSVQAQLRPQANQQHYSSGIGFPPPPWAPTPGYYTGKTHVSAVGYGMVSSAENGHHSPNLVAQAAKPSPHLSSYSSPTGTNGSVMMGDAEVKSGPVSTGTQQKPYIPTYRLFEDLNVLGNTDGKLKMIGSTSPSLSGASCSSQGIVGGTHRGLGNF